MRAPDRRRAAVGLALLVAVVLVWPAEAALAGRFSAAPSASQQLSTALLGTPAVSLACSGSGAAGGTVTLSWPAITHATGYTVTRTGGLTGPKVTTVSTTSAVDTIGILGVSTTYSYTVTSSVAAWTSPASAAHTATFPPLSACSTT